VLEALQNVAKHSGASKATVQLVQSDNRLHFVISDDGRGIDPVRARSGSGLQNMRDRVEVLGGRLEIRSTPQQGTQVSGSIPSLA
jgi:signal transduction histidine kinase